MRTESTKKILNKLLNNVGDMALKRRARKIVEGLELKNGDTVLDIGCGDGYYTYLISSLELNLKLYASDFDKNALNSASKNLKNRGIKFQQADLMDKLPYKDSFFNKIVMSEVAEHLPNDVKGLKEVYRVLKPGGVLCLTVPNAKYPFLWDPINWLLELMTGQHIGAGFWAGIWNQHVRLYKVDQLQKVVEKAGFKVNVAESYTWWCLPFNHTLIYIVARLLYGGGLPPDIAQSISKFSSKPPRKRWLIKMAFEGVNLFDKVNDLYQFKNIGVGVFIKAYK